MRERKEERERERKERRNPLTKKVVVGKRSMSSGE